MLDKKHEVMQLGGKPILCSPLRLKRALIPEGLYCYDIQSTDNGMEPFQIRNHILVNHYATIVTSYPLELDAEGSWYLNDGDLDEITNYGHMSIQEYLDKYVNQPVQALQ